MVPHHVGIILDGNRRWAKALGKGPSYGHKKGYEKLKDVAKWMLDAGVKILTVYAFSTENWKRSKSEVTFLMKFIKKALTEEIDEFDKEGIKLNIIGSRKGLDKDLVKVFDQAEKRTSDNKKGTLNIAFNYGGRLEIIEAINELIKKGVKKIDEAVVSNMLYTKGQPDPDLIIRTSGEQRLSGFLLWQASYAELYFTKTHWPAFSKKDFNDVLNAYADRQRRYGK